MSFRSKRVQHDYYAVDSEWTPEAPGVVLLLPTIHLLCSLITYHPPRSVQLLEEPSNQLSFKVRGLCERAFDYASLFPATAFRVWSNDDRRQLIDTLKKAAGLTSYLHVVDIGVPTDGEPGRVAQLVKICNETNEPREERVAFYYGLCLPATLFRAASEKDSLRARLDELRVVDRILAIANQGNCTRFAFFFDESAAPYLLPPPRFSSSSPSTSSSRPATSEPARQVPLSALHCTAANYLLEKTLNRIAEAKRKDLEFCLMPLFYGSKNGKVRSRWSMMCGVMPAR